MGRSLMLSAKELARLLMSQGNPVWGKENTELDSVYILFLMLLK